MTQYSEFKIGHGYDVHRLTENRSLIIGGVKIPHRLGLLGHSDADVLLHAICDAVLGALGEGDIGIHFPDCKTEYKDISSLIIAEKCAEIMTVKGYGIGNIDATVIAQTPKLSPYIAEMKKNIAKVFSASPETVNIKATTEEYLGFSGREEGMAAHAVVLLKKIEQRRFSEI